MPDLPLGWTITVQLAKESTPVVYNVAIPNERDAIEGVKRVLPEAKSAIIKVKSQLTERVFKALKMKPGDVLLGAQRKKAKTTPTSATLG